VNDSKPFTPTPKRIAIRGGRVIDPARDIDEVRDLFIEGPFVADDRELSSVDEEIDARGMIVSPGFIDLHVTLGEPGYEEDETTRTGTAAAVRGGFTSICVLPSTDPVVDNRAGAEFVKLEAARAGLCEVYPIGAVTRRLEGRELADIGQLVEAGAVAFSDADRPIANAEIMRRSLQYTGMFDRPIFHRAIVPELIANGVMHEGELSTLLGLTGMPRAAEEIMVARDIALAELTGGRVHLMSLASGSCVDLVRRAKARGLGITADVTPHHLTLTDEQFRSFDSVYKVNPPLRTQTDIDALIAGLVDGTIDAISSDHRPQAAEKMSGELDQDPYGVVGLETLLGVCATHLVGPGHLNWSQLLARLTVGPANILNNSSKASLSPGSEADVTIIDPAAEWMVDPKTFRSKSRNTPFAGWKLTGQVKQTIVRGELLFDVAWNGIRPTGR